MTISQPPLRVAVLGLGFMGSTHLKALRRVEGAQLAGVYSRDPKKLSGDLTGIQGNVGGPGEQVDFTGIAQYREWEALLADSSIDAVDLCLPTDLHAPVALQALAAGKHVLVEKPMALTGGEADEMVAAAARQNRVLMAAHVLRFWPEYVALHNAAVSQNFGPLRYAGFRRRCASPAWGGWLQNAERSGGGILDLMIHDVDMCLHLLGMPETVSATGCTGSGGIDWIDASLTWGGGERAQISGGWLHPGDFPFAMEFTAAFAEASLEFSSSCRPLTLYPAGGAAKIPELATVDAYEAEIRYFVECCLAGHTPELCPPGESAGAVRLIEDILRSRSSEGEIIRCMK